MGSLLVVSMFPQISIAGPVWSLLQSLGWLNSYQGLIIPYVTLTLPLGVWILTSFFKELPKDLEDSARIDGCSRIQTLYKIVIPLAAPGVFTAGILVFIYAWNEFFFAFILTSRKARTLPVLVQSFLTFSNVRWGEMMAMSLVIVIPLIIFVFAIQRYIVTGLTLGAVEE